MLRINMGLKFHPEREYITSAKDDKMNCVPSNHEQKDSTYRLFSRFESFFSQLPLNEQTNSLEKSIV